MDGFQNSFKTTTSVGLTPASRLKRARAHALDVLRALGAWVGIPVQKDVQMPGDFDPSPEQQTVILIDAATLQKT